MKKVLIITDNTYLYEAITRLIEEANRRDVEFTFAHSKTRSAIWEHEDFSDGTKVLDVKEEVKSIIAEYSVVISVHCFQLFPKELVEKVRCINVHPGYNPVNRGWYPQIFSIIHDLPIGATIHEMDEKIDNGPIIARSYVEKYVWDSSMTIYERVLEKELSLFRDNFDSIIDGSYERLLPEGEGNFFSKADFNDICEIDLGRRGSFKEFYDLMRALSHGEFRNAYFIDETTGEKIYLKLEICRESAVQGT